MKTIEYYQEKFKIAKSYNNLLSIKAPFQIDKKCLPMPIDLYNGVYIKYVGYIVDITDSETIHILLLNSEGFNHFKQDNNENSFDFDILK